MKLVAFAGYAQHGKDSAAKTLIDRGYVKVAFADQLRKAALAINPLILDWSRLLRGRNPLVRLSTFVSEVGWEVAKKHPEVRRILQVVGTEAGREIHGDDCWVRAHEREASKHEKVVTTDCRFPNEADYIHNRGGIIVRLKRPGFKNGIGKLHASEQHVESLPADIELTNDGDLTDLYFEVEAILNNFEGVFPLPMAFITGETAY